MSSSVTITAKDGPGITATGLVITNVDNVNFDLRKGMIQIFQGSQYKEFALNTVTAVTYSISGANYTITVS